MPAQTDRKAEAVLQEVKKDIRNAILAALQRIEAETGLNPSEVSIYVEMISEGAQFGRERPRHLLGQVITDFKV